MKKLAFVVAAASLFALAPVANRFGPVASSIALVWLGVLVAICASGTANAMAVATGALGAFGAGVLAPLSPAAAGAVIVAAAFAERTTRIRSRTARAVHVLVALVGGALAGSLSSAFSASSLPVTVVAVIVASVLAAASFNARQNSGNILGVGSEGILISRIRIDQQRAEFERRIHNMLINVEASYWRLYQAYGRLYSFEEVMRIAHKSWLTNHAKFVAGTIGPANYYPIRGQYLAITRKYYP